MFCGLYNTVAIVQQRSFKAKLCLSRFGLRLQACLRRPMPSLSSCLGFSKSSLSSTSYLARTASFEGFIGPHLAIHASDDSFSRMVRIILAVHCATVVAYNDPQNLALSHAKKSLLAELEGQGSKVTWDTYSASLRSTQAAMRDLNSLRPCFITNAEFA